MFCAVPDVEKKKLDNAQSRSIIINMSVERIQEKELQGVGLRSNSDRRSAMDKTSFNDQLNAGKIPEGNCRLIFLSSGRQLMTKIPKFGLDPQNLRDLMVGWTAVGAYHGWDVVELIDGGGEVLIQLSHVVGAWDLSIKDALDVIGYRVPPPAAMLKIPSGRKTN
jgi:hypothetical protein